MRIGAALTSGFGQAFQSADSRLRQLGEAASGMNSRLATMRGFQQLEEATKKLATEWQEARARARTLRAELDAMQPALQQQSAALRTANTEVTRSGDRYRAAKMALEQLRAEIKASGQPTQQQAAALRQAQQAAEQARNSWQRAKEQAKGLAQDMKQADAAAREKARALQQAEQAASRAEQQFRRNRDTMRGMREEMKKAGTDTKNLAEEQKKLEQQLARTEAQQRKLAATRAAQQGNLDKRGDYRSGMFDTAAFGLALTAPIRSAVQFETAMLGIARQVEGARDESGKLTDVYFSMGKQIQQLGREIPYTTTEIAGMVTAGARMGIANDGLIEFTRLAAQMATAFDEVPEELADKMGKIGNNFKIPVTEIRGLADSINYLDDNALAKGGDIIEFMNRVGGTAPMIKISAQETAAFGSALLSLGERSETASTAMNAVFSKLGAANTQSKPFRAMVKEIGLSTGDLGRGMQTDAVGTIYKVMDAIRKLPKVAKDGQTSQIDAVATLFGAEHWDTFSKLLEGRDELNRQLALSTGNTKYAEQIQDATKKADAFAKAGKAAGSMQREFEARMQTTAAQGKTFSNALNVVAVNIGTVLLPAVNAIMAPIANIAMVIGDFASENQTLTKYVLGAAVALTALRFATLVSGFAWTFYRGALLSARLAMITTSINIGAMNAALAGMAATGLASATAGLAALRTRMAALSWGGVVAGARAAGAAMMAMSVTAGTSALAGMRAFGTGILTALMNPLATARGGFMALTGAIRAVGVALIANPIGLIATGIAVAGLLIYQHWQQVKAFFSGFAQGVMAGIGPAMPVFEGIKNSVMGIVQWFGALLAPVNASSEQLAAATDAGRSFGEVVGSAIGSVLGIIGKVVEAIGGMTSAAMNGIRAVGEFFGLSGAAPTPATAQAAAAKAGGGAAASVGGGAGQAGAAVRGLAAVPAAAAPAGQKNVSVTNTPTYNVTVNAQGGNPDDIAKATRREMERMQANARAQSRAAMYDQAAY